MIDVSKIHGVERGLSFDPFLRKHRCYIATSRGRRQKAVLSNEDPKIAVGRVGVLGLQLHFAVLSRTRVSEYRK